jgi:hypothetical protein
MSDQILKGCDEVRTMKDAQKPVITPLLPIKGLRHDENGDLTADAMKTVTDGMTSLGIDTGNEDAQSAIVAETRQAVCNLNAQYQFLLTKMFMAIKNNEPAPSKLIDLIKEKNLAMRDILSVSRQILETFPSNKKTIEGWTNMQASTNVKNNLSEGFSNLQNKLADEAVSIEGGDFKLENFAGTSVSADVQRAFDISEEKIKSVSANLALYSFMNVIAIGLLFYIVSTN